MSTMKRALLALLFAVSLPLSTGSWAQDMAAQDGSISVKLFGAKGDGVSDDTRSIQAAISRAAQTHSRVVFPPGTYLISAPVRTNPSLNIKNPTLDVELAAATESNWMYNSGTMATTIKAIGSWAADAAMLDLRDTGRLSVKGLGIDCQAKNIRGIEIGDEKGPTGPGSTNIYIGGNSIHNCSKNLVGYNTGLLNVVRNNISSASGTGLWFQYMGDSDFEGNFVNTNAPSHIEAGDYDQAGGFFCAWCGNTSIHGGKIEWNARGIALFGSQGMSIYGISFDVNRTQAIEIHYDQNTAQNNVYQPRSVDIYGNRFLAGGSRSQSSGAGRRDFITIIGDNAGVDERVTVVANTFRKGSDQAYDLNPGPNIGPIDDVIGVYGNTVNVTIAGNDMRDGAGTNCVWEANNPNVHWYGNDCNLPIVLLNSSKAAMDLPVPIVSTVPAGTAPISFQSSTPMTVGVMANHPEVFIAGALSTGIRIYTNSVRLSGGQSQHTFAHSFTFSNNSYTCQATDTTSPAAVSITNVSPNSILVRGTGADLIAISCTGD
jgi:hypothetical protein